MKGIKIYSVLIIMIILYPLNVFSEIPDNSGYIITLNQDTVRGFIQNININQYTECEFRKDEHSPVIKYLPGEILAYRFTNNGKFFISKKIPDTEKKQRTVFLEYLIKGKANIYFLRDKTDHYFMQKDDGQIFELSETPVLEKNDEGITYYKPQKFTGKLKYLLSDCPAVFNQINNTKLNPNELISLAKEYHNKVCDSARCIIFERKISPVKIKTGLLAGISNNNYYFNPQNYTDRRSSLFAGFKVEFENLFFSSERVAFASGLIFQHYSTYNFHVDAYEYNGVPYQKNQILDYDLKLTSFKIPLTVSYVFSQHKFRPYLGLGINNIFYVTQNPALYITDYVKLFHYII